MRGLSALLAAVAACGGSPAPPAVYCPEPGTAAPAAAPVKAAPSIKPADDELAALAWLVGRWRGTGHGEPGDATVERSYRFVLRGRFLEVDDKSTYKPQPANPQGEVHEDHGLISHDRGRKLLVLRQFHGEGFVNQYALDSATDNTWVFESEAIENIPDGYRARETIRRLGPDRFEETFEIAEPDAAFAVYSQATLERVTN
ncbi:MAG TPA: heme-binding beta-barrel domain-containing protein [Kofleriaceae bacterium]|nr:heme-binding beta-barrel domain-containing protein [Kofleriaceae bacterium]